MTYGPTIVGRFTGRIPKDQFMSALIEKSPAPIQSIFLKKTNTVTVAEGTGTVEGTQTSRPPVVQNFPAVPSNPRDIPEYLRTVVDTTTNQVIQKGSETVSQTTLQVTQHVCEQIVTEIQKKCMIDTSMQ